MKLKNNDFFNLIKEIKKHNIDETLLKSISSAYENRVNEYIALKEKYEKMKTMMENPLETLPQYALERDEFTEIYNDCVIYVYYNHPIETDDFKAWYSDDEWYILHKPSGTMINWYKHSGRTNTCNKILTKEQHKTFANMFLEDVSINS